MNKIDRLTDSRSETVATIVAMVSLLESAPEIVNECITIMGNQLLRHLLDEIRTNSNILADETRDVSNCEQ